jgi:hypothetical protein
VQTHQPNAGTEAACYAEAAPAPCLKIAPFSSGLSKIEHGEQFREKNRHGGGRYAFGVLLLMLLSVVPASAPVF